MSALLKSVFKFFRSFFRSKTLAIWLIIIITVFSLLSALLFQEDHEPYYSIWAKDSPKAAKILKTLGLSHISRTWYFSAVALLFAINLIFCTYDRAAAVLRRWSNPPKQPTKAAAKASVDVSSNPDSFLPQVQKLLKKHRFRRIRSSESTILATKNRWLLASSVLFHISLIVVLVGGYLTAFTRTFAFIPLTVGEGKSIPVAGRQLYAELLDARVSSTKKNFAVTQTSELFVKDEQEQLSDIVEPGTQLNFKGINFYAAQAGFAPEIILLRNKGELINVFVSLQTDRKKGKIKFEDELFIANRFMRVELKFYPDAEIKKGQVVSKGFQPTRPAITFAIYEGRNKEPKAKGNVFMGETREAGKYAISFPSFRYWIGYQAVYDRGTDVIFAGSWAAILFVMLLYLFPYQEMWVIIERKEDKTRVYLGGRSDRFPKLFNSKFEEFVAELKNHSGGTS